MKLVYVAGPFTGPTPWHVEQNVRRAELVGLAVVEAGASPLIPHAIGRFFVGTGSPEFWYDATLEQLKRSDAIVLVPNYNASTGSRVELAWARQNKRPVFKATFAGDFSIGHLRAHIGPLENSAPDSPVSFVDWVKFGHACGAAVRA